MFGILVDGHVAGLGAVGVDELGGVQRRAAFLALVAVGAGGVAHGALAHDVAVGDKAVGALVIRLLGGALDEDVVVVQALEELGGRAAVLLRSGAGIDVEADAKLLERVLDELVIAVDDILRCDAFAAGADGDGHAVLVRAAHQCDGAVVESQEAGVYVGGNVHAGEVTDVHGAVGVGERRGDEGAFIFFCHVCCLFCYLLIII